jgi:hypothetical protein
MKLATIEMPQEEAEQAFKEYRRVVRSAKTAQVNSEDAQIARCYKALAGGHQVIDLNDVMRRGGENSKGLPRLAICRADYEQVEMLRDWETGDIEMFAPGLQQWRAGTTYLGRVFRFPALTDIRSATFTEPNWNRTRQMAIQGFTAIVPNIPPALRPPHSLQNYHLLWEARWEPKKKPRRAPDDPALLKHLGGPLYAVLATWDLTPVEQAVLGVMRN